MNHIHYIELNQWGVNHQQTWFLPTTKVVQWAYHRKWEYTYKHTYYVYITDGEYYSNMAGLL